MKVPFCILKGANTLIPFKYIYVNLQKVEIIAYQGRKNMFPRFDPLGSSVGRLMHGIEKPTIVELHLSRYSCLLYACVRGP